MQQRPPRMIRSILAALLVALAPVGAAAQEREIVVRGATAKAEIERILKADNLDPERLSAGDIAATMTRIDRGRAPDDFWAAYQAHVRAWQQMAEAEEALRNNGLETLPSPEIAAKVAAAEEAVETSFDEVERIALAYGARMPVPPGEIERMT